VWIARQKYKRIISKLHSIKNVVGYVRVEETFTKNPPKWQFKEISYKRLIPILGRNCIFIFTSWMLYKSRLVRISTRASIILSFIDFAQSLQANSWIPPWLGHEHLLPNLFRIIIYQSPYTSTPYTLRYCVLNSSLLTSVHCTDHEFFICRQPQCSALLLII
jgi:hypothetical protein